MSRTQSIARFGEDVAARYLESLGMRLLDRNWRCRHGELDIVARSAATLVIVEVKTRATLTCGPPIEAVTPRKVRRLRQCALAWLDSRQLHAPAVRFDVIGVSCRTHGAPVVEHIVGVT